MPPRCVPVRLQIDTNRINARGGLPAMNTLERWRADGVVEILISEVAQFEAMRGGNAQRFEKAGHYVFTETLVTTDQEQSDLSQIERAIFASGASTPSERNDVQIAFNAAKYGAILVTADGASGSQPGGILGSRAALARLGVRVLIDSEAVALVWEKIRQRDEMARIVAQYEGRHYPSGLARTRYQPPTEPGVARPSFAAEADTLLHRELLPAIRDIEDAVKSNGYLMSVVSRIVNRPMGATAGSVLGFGLSRLADIPGLAAGAIAGAGGLAVDWLAAHKAWLDNRQHIEGHQLYFYYRARQHLE